MNSTDLYNGQLILHGFFAAVSAAGACGNGFVIATFIRHRDLQQQGLIFIALLAVGDLLVEVSYFYWRVVHLFSQLVGVDLTRIPCLLLIHPLNVSMLISQTFTVWMAYDRFRSLAYPFAYFGEKGRPLYVKRKLCIVALFAFVTTGVPQIFVNWSVESVHCVLGAPENLWIQVYSTFITLLFPVLVCYFYARALLVHCTKKAQVAPNVRRNSMNEHHRKQVRITKTIVRVLAIYCLLWVMPFLIFNAIHMIQLDSVSRLILIDGSYFVGIAVNSGANVLAYSTKSSIIKQYMHC